MILLISNRPEWVGHGIGSALAQTLGLPLRVVLHGIEVPIPVPDKSWIEVQHRDADVPYLEVLNDAWPREPGQHFKWDDHDLYPEDWCETALAAAPDGVGMPIITQRLNAGEELEPCCHHVTASGAVAPGRFRFEYFLGSISRHMRRFGPQRIPSGIIQRTPRGLGA